MQTFVYMPATYDFDIDTNERTNVILSDAYLIFGQDDFLLIYNVKTSRNLSRPAELLYNFSHMHCRKASTLSTLMAKLSHYAEVQDTSAMIN